MKVLLGATAHNPHVQNLALALLERGMLDHFLTSSIDHFEGPVGRMLRSGLMRSSKRLGRAVSRAKVEAVPPEYLRNRVGWGALRSVTSLFWTDPLWADRLWDLEERSLSADCARRIRTGAVDAFLGVEYGSLEAVRAARAAGKRSIVAFLSPHHLFRRKWLEPEYRRYPELLTPATRRLNQLSIERDARRDLEAKEADILHTNSHMTKATLVDAGFDGDKIISVPLGAPPPDAAAERGPLSGPPKVIFVGGLAVHKGAHHLLEAWKRLDVRGGAQLHLYGSIELPPSMLSGLGPNVFLHGPAPRQQVAEAMREALFLVLPTLCDGFGMVVMEAMAVGLPVVTTPNAGASSFIKEGENGHLVPPADPESLAHRLYRCLSDPRRVAGMSECARRTAASWTWKDFREQFATMLIKKLAMGPAS